MMYVNIAGHSAGPINFSCTIPKYDSDGAAIEPDKYYIGFQDIDNETGVWVFTYNEDNEIIEAPLFVATPTSDSPSNQVATKGYVDATSPSSLTKMLLKGGSASSW